MADKALSGMGLPLDLLHVFRARNILTAKDVLMRTELELLALLDVPEDVLRPALALICEQTAPPCRTVQEIWERRAAEEPGRGHLGTTLAGLDRALCGGIPFGAVTEVVAAAGMGKTQLCMMLAVLGTVPLSSGGLDGCVLYVDAERSFRPKRMLQIARARFPDKAVRKDLAHRVLVLQPGSMAEFMVAVQALDGLVTAHGVKLLIMDSVAALVQEEYGLDRVAERQQALGRAASRLKFLAEAFRMPVVVTNQVRVQRGGQGDVPVFEQPSGDGDDEMQLAPALGTRWAHAVNVRLVLESHLGQRFVKIAKCPLSGVVRFPYTITTGGVEQVSAV